MTAGNQMHLQGLPFTAASLFQKAPVTTQIVTLDTNAPVLSIANAGTSAGFTELTSGTNLTQILVSDFTSGTADVFATFEYFVA